MWKIINKNKFLIISLVLLLVYSIVDINITLNALKNTGTSIINMLLVVPPIFVLIGLFDVWVPREKVIQLMGENSGIKGMLLAGFLGAFSAGPTVAAFPIAMIMMKKGAKHSNVMFFLMVWSTLKLPIVIYQVAAVGWKLATVMNVTMLVMFIIGAWVTGKIFTEEETTNLYEKATNYSNK